MIEQILMAIVPFIAVFVGFLVGLSQQKDNFKPILKVKWKDGHLEILIQKENGSRHWVSTLFTKEALKND